MKKHGIEGPKALSPRLTSTSTRMHSFTHTQKHTQSHTHAHIHKSVVGDGLVFEDWVLKVVWGGRGVGGGDGGGVWCGVDGSGGGWG